MNDSNVGSGNSPTRSPPLSPSSFDHRSTNFLPLQLNSFSHFSLLSVIAREFRISPTRIDGEEMKHNTRPNVTHKLDSCRARSDGRDLYMLDLKKNLFQHVKARVWPRLARRRVMAIRREAQALNCQTEFGYILGVHLETNHICPRNHHRF